MTVRQLIPQDLADVPPGPELARVLAGIELPRLSGFDCVEVLKARYRQLNHDRARLMAAMAEVGVCGVVAAGDELRRMAVPDEFSADEVRAALMLTRRAADAQFGLAYDVVTRLPAVHAAMDAGVLDEPRARVFSEWTMGLRPEAARAVCAELLPRAPGLTTGQLVEQIKKWAIALDPDWARRRYEQAVAERRVVGYRNPDGSANLCGYNLPVDRVAAASGHIDALAKAAKHAGDTRPIDHIRAELFLGMTDGTYAGLEDAAILAHLRTTRENEEGPGDHSGAADERGADRGRGPCEGGEPEDKGEPRHDGEVQHDAGADGDGPDGDGPDGDGPDGDGPDGDGSDGDGSDGDGPDDDGPDGGAEPEDCGPGGGGGPEGGGGAAGDKCPAAAEGSVWRAGVGAGMELRARLSTLLGRDQYPGELAGWGPVHAELACELALTMGRGQWRFAITGEQGQLLHCGITQARPRGAPARGAACRAILEVQVPALTLRALGKHPSELGAWATVVSDLLRQLGRSSPGQHPDLHRRTPTAALRRYLDTRDRTCIMIGCRAPAHTTDKDHTHNHAHGGPTTGDNLGSPCRHDHRLKHDGGWQLHQPHPGHFRWISRLGHTYHRPLPPILEPLPTPLAAGQPPNPPLVPADPDWENSQIWEQPLESEAESEPEPEPDSGKDPPPF